MSIGSPRPDWSASLEFMHDSLGQSDGIAWRLARYPDYWFARGGSRQMKQGLDFVYCKYCWSLWLGAMSTHGTRSRSLPS